MTFLQSRFVAHNDIDAYDAYDDADDDDEDDVGGDAHSFQ